MDMNIEAITVMRERYEELIKAEARLQFLKEVCQRDGYISVSDIMYYLGIPEEESKDESNK